VEFFVNFAEMSLHKSPDQRLGGPIVHNNLFAKRVAIGGPWRRRHAAVRLGGFPSYRGTVASEIRATA